MLNCSLNIEKAQRVGFEEIMREDKNRNPTHNKQRKRRQGGYSYPNWQQGKTNFLLIEVPPSQRRLKTRKLSDIE